MSFKDIEKWWDEASVYYQEDAKISVKQVHYGPSSPDEDRLRLLGRVKGKKILEIGCGGGQNSIALAKQGGDVTGLDISSSQLKFAKELAEKNKAVVRFKKHNIQTLKGIGSGSYDIVVSAFALQYIPNLTRCFKEVYRVLKKKGIFVFSFDHPFFHTVKSKSFKMEISYNKTGKEVIKDVWPDGSLHKFVIYRRKISDIFNSLIEAGFKVTKILEPFDKKDKRWKGMYKPKKVEFLPPTIIFKSVKD